MPTVKFCPKAKRTKSKRVNSLRRAAGIAPGDPYYTWKVRTGRGSIQYYSKTQPTLRSQMTASIFKSAFYRIQEQLERCTQLFPVKVECLETIADQMIALGNEQRDKQSNQPPGAKEGKTGQMLLDRAAICEDWIAELGEAGDDRDKLLTLATRSYV